VVEPRLAAEQLGNRRRARAVDHAERVVDSRIVIDAWIEALHAPHVDESLEWVSRAARRRHAERERPFSRRGRIEKPRNAEAAHETIAERLERELTGRIESTIAPPPVHE